MNIATIMERAIDSAVVENGFYSRIAGDGVWYVWADHHKGPDTASDGFIYMREGAIVKIDDCTVIVRAVSDNGLNCGEAKLTGFAATHCDLIRGIIESALEL